MSPFFYRSCVVIAFLWNLAIGLFLASYFLTSEMALRQYIDAAMIPSGVIIAILSFNAMTILLIIMCPRPQQLDASQVIVRNQSVEFQQRWIEMEAQGDNETRREGNSSDPFRREDVTVGGNNLAIDRIIFDEELSNLSDDNSVSF